jgi:hypothetical protein
MAGQHPQEQRGAAPASAEKKYAIPLFHCSSVFFGLAKTRDAMVAYSVRQSTRTTQSHFA